MPLVIYIVSAVSFLAGGLVGSLCLRRRIRSEVRRAYTLGRTDERTWIKDAIRNPHLYRNAREHEPA